MHIFLVLANNSLNAHSFEVGRVEAHLLAKRLNEKPQQHTFSLNKRTCTYGFRAKPVVVRIEDASSILTKTHQIARSLNLALATFCTVLIVTRMSIALDSITVNRLTLHWVYLRGRVYRYTHVDHITGCRWIVGYKPFHRKDSGCTPQIILTMRQVWVAYSGRPPQGVYRQSVLHHRVSALRGIAVSVFQIWITQQAIN